jgi:uncharacterized protein YlxW (UPF0749 family)
MHKDTACSQLCTLVFTQYATHAYWTLTFNWPLLPSAWTAQAAAVERTVEEERAAAQAREAELQQRLRELQRECAEREAAQRALQAEVEELTNQVTLPLLKFTS